MAHLLFRVNALARQVAQVTLIGSDEAIVRQPAASGVGDPWIAIRVAEYVV